MKAALWAGKQAWFLGTSHGLHHIYAVPLAPLLILVQADLGEPLTRLGLAIAAGELCGGLLQLGMGLVADRWGRKRLLVLGFGLQTVAMLVLSLASNLWMVTAGMLLLGVGNSTYHPASFTLIAAEKARAVNTRLAFHNSFGLLGTAFSFTVYASLAGWLGWRPAVQIIAASGAILTLVLSVILEEVGSTPAPARTPGDQSSIGGSEERPRANGPGESKSAGKSRVAREVLFLGCFSLVGGAFVQGLNYLLPTFLVLGHSLSLEQANGLVTILFLLGGVGTLIGGPWVDKVGEVRAMLVGGLAAAGLMLWLAYGSPGTVWLILVVAGIGLGQAMARTALSGVVAKLRSYSHGGLYGLQFGTLYLGGAIGVPLLAYIADSWGVSHAAAMIAPPLAIYSFAALVLQGRRMSHVPHASVDSSSTMS